MNRRTFLIGAATTALMLSARALVPQPIPWETDTIEATVGGRLLRGTNHGQILESLDNGESWRVLAKFGDHCAVKALEERGTQIYTRVHVQGHPFVLRSTDARTWNTADSSSTPL